MGELSYLIRYGVMSHVGRFSALPMCETIFERGQLVVIRTDRGVELGEVLTAVEGKPVAAGHQPGATAAQEGEIDLGSLVAADSPHVLRLADPEDLARSKSAQAARPSRFSVCQRILQEGNWPWELVDVEPLLDGRATVIHYLGPHRLDVAPLRARFRVECDIDVVLEPIGADLDSEAADQDPDPHEIGGGLRQLRLHRWRRMRERIGSAAGRPWTRGRARRDWVRPRIAFRLFLLRHQ